MNFLIIDYVYTGKYIAKLRKQKKLTQADLAEFIDVSSQYISHIETAKKHASVETLLKIAKVLDSTVDQLIDSKPKYKKYEYDPLFAELLSDCSRDELEEIYFIASAVKDFNRKKQSIY